MVKCSQCGNNILRVIWNYSKNRPMKEFFCNKGCKGLWQKAQREKLGYTKEWLYQKYIIEGLDCNQISKIVNRNSKQVWNWIKDYGIQTRQRGHNTSLLCKDGSVWKGRNHKQETKDKIRQCRMDDGRVPYLINNQHWLCNVPKEKTPNWKGGITPERQSLYSSREWSDAVKNVWERDNATCRRCGMDHRLIDRGKIKFHIHHIDGFSVKEKRTDPKNLVLLCDKCHRWVHSNHNKNKFLLGMGHGRECND